LELINLIYVMDLLFFKSLSPGLPKSTQLLLRRHHGLRTCIPGLEGTLMIKVSLSLRLINYHVLNKYGE
jgi:hypothetical protein